MKKKSGKYWLKKTIAKTELGSIVYGKKMSGHVGVLNDEELLYRLKYTKEPKKDDDYWNRTSTYEGVHQELVEDIRDICEEGWNLYERRQNWIEAFEQSIVRRSIPSLDFQKRQREREVYVELQTNNS